MMKRLLMNEDFLKATARPPHLYMVNCFLNSQVTLIPAPKGLLRSGETAPEKSSDLAALKTVETKTLSFCRKFYRERTRNEKL